jgi:predicted RNase H-like nuclease (RuvC/YqgF family)
LQTIHEDKTTLSRAIAQNKQLKDQLTELQDRFIKMSNDNMNLTNQIQAQEHLNKQLNERLTQTQTTVHVQDHEQSSNDQETTAQRLNELLEENQSLRERLSQLEQQPQSQPTIDVQLNDSTSLSSLGSPVDDTPQPQNGFIEKIIDRFNRAMRDNADLQDRTQQLEHLILQLQSETDTIGDYISLYQQQRQHLHRRYQEKDDYIKQLTHDRLSLQRKLSELETLLTRGLNKPSTDIPEQQKTVPDESHPVDQPQHSTDENEWPEMIDNTLSSSEQTTSSHDEKTTISTNNTSPSLISLSNFDDETKTRILTLLKELGQNDNSSSETDNLSTAKLAFIGKNLYVCSTCTGPVQWV